MIPVQFVFNRYNICCLGSYELERETDIDFISIYIDAITLNFENSEENLIKAICYTIEHEVWHYLLKDLNLIDDHSLIYTIMDYRPMAKIKFNLGEILDKKRKEIDKKVCVAYT